MTRQQLFDNIRRKGSFLCVGLDTDIRRLPPHLKDDKNAIFTFNKAIIDRLDLLHLHQKHQHHHLNIFLCLVHLLRQKQILQKNYLLRI